MDYFYFEGTCLMLHFPKTLKNVLKNCVIPVRCVKIGSLYGGFIRCSVHFQYLSFLVEKKPCFSDDPFLFYSHFIKVNICGLLSSQLSQKKYNQ